MNAFWIGFSTQKINGRLVGGTLSDGTTANTRLAGWLRKVVARNELTMRTRSMQLHRLLSARSRACAASQIDDNRLAFGSLWKDAKEWHKYDAFGAVRILAPNGTERTTSLYKNRFLFTGREYAATFGFYEYRARAYSPTLGRFMSEDPKGFVRRVGLGTAPADWTFGTHPDEAEYNLFRYCANDPIDFTDPLGLESPAWAQAIIPGQTEWDSAVANFQAGNYGNAVGWTAAMVAQQYLAVATLGTSMRVQQSVQGARVASQEVSAVIGKFPNYLKVADKLGAKRFNIPPAIWNRMTDAERWGANQRFLDRAIARRGDIMLDKPIKSIESVSGQLRRELDYVAQKGYTLSEDGSRMRPPPPEMS